MRAVGLVIAGVITSATLSSSVDESRRVGHGALSESGPAARVAHAPATLEVPRPGSVSTSPRGQRVPLGEPLRLRFADRPAKVDVRVQPETALEQKWIDAQTLELTPETWKPGHRYRVEVRAGALSESWEFRTRVPYPGGVVAGGGACLVLSFDDGPSERGDAVHLLDVLHEGGARAVFFPTGSWAQQVPAWVERARREGHLVCNHTLHHADLTAPRMTEQRIREEIEGGVGHGRCSLLRPPQGAWNARVQKVAEALGYQPYLWDIDSRDWDAMPVLDVVNLVLGQARPGKVVLLHMHAQGTLEALPRIIKWLSASGYVLSHDAADCGGSGLVGARGWGEWPQRPRHP